MDLEKINSQTEPQPHLPSGGVPLGDHKDPLHECQKYCQ